MVLSGLIWLAVAAAAALAGINSGRRGNFKMVLNLALMIKLNTSSLALKADLWLVCKINCKFWVFLYTILRPFVLKNYSNLNLSAIWPIPHFGWCHYCSEFLAIFKLSWHRPKGGNGLNSGHIQMGLNSGKNYEISGQIAKVRTNGLNSRQMAIFQV